MDRQADDGVDTDSSWRGESLFSDNGVMTFLPLLLLFLAIPRP